MEHRNKPLWIKDMSDSPHQTLNMGLESIVQIRFVEAFTEAIQEVMKACGCTPLTQGPPTFGRPLTAPCTTGDVSGLIPMAAELYSGTLGLHFSETLALQIHEKMQDEHNLQINDAVINTVIEVTNQVFTNVKRDLNELGHNVCPANAVVVYGAGHKLKHPSQSIFLNVPYTSAEGSLTLQCVIRTFEI